MRCVLRSWGGLGADTISYVLMLEEVARVDAAMAVALSVTNSLAVLPVYKYGTEAQKQKYLSGLAHGEILGSFCLTEPQAGSDAAAIETRAERSGKTYRLNGTKSWVTNGGESGVYLVFAKTEPAAGAPGVAKNPEVVKKMTTAFLVEPGFSGFRVSRYEDKMGLRSSRSAEIVFTDCEVPEENRLGEEGQGLKIALEALDGGRTDKRGGVDLLGQELLAGLDGSAAPDRAGARDHPLRRAALGCVTDLVGTRRDQPPRPHRPRLK